MKLHSLLVALFTVAFMASGVFAQNHTLSYQGQLDNAVGDPVNASYPMVFTLYAEAEGGELPENWEIHHDEAGYV